MYHANQEGWSTYLQAIWICYPCEQTESMEKYPHPSWFGLLDGASAGGLKGPRSPTPGNGVTILQT